MYQLLVVQINKKLNQTKSASLLLDMTPHPLKGLCSLCVAHDFASITVLDIFQVKYM